MAGTDRLAAHEADGADHKVTPGAGVAGLHPGTEPHFHLRPFPGWLPIGAPQLEFDAVLSGDELPVGAVQRGVVFGVDEVDVWGGLDAHWWDGEERWKEEEEQG